MFKKIGAYLGDNAVQIDADEGEKNLRKDCPDLLLPHEKVLFGFKDRGGAGRDDKYLTSSRILIRDVKGMTGKHVQYTSVPYSSIKAYSVESVGGGFDTDCTLVVHSTGVGQISMDFTKDVNILAINRHLNEMILVDGSIGASVPGGAEATTSTPVPGQEGGISKFLNKLGGDASQIPTAECEAQFKTDPHILMDDEKVEMAFQCGRDAFLLTSKRILQIDVQGWSGKRVVYVSILWKCLRAFSIETAGTFDRDVDMMIYTDIRSLPRIEQDFRKGHCDVYAIQKFFADKLLGVDTVQASAEAVSMAGVQDSGSGSLFAWMGDDSRMIDAAQINQQYHTNPPILQASEHVEMAFKGRRDMTLFTTKRLLLVDCQGWTGKKKVEYLSIPWTTVQAYAVRSAGSWMDKDSEMMIWTDINDVFFPAKQGDNPPPPPIPRKSYIEIDFQKDKVDLMAIQRYLSARCLRVADGGYLSPEVSVDPSIMQASAAGSVENFLSWLGDDARAIDPNELNQQLHTGNVMLQTDERVVMAFKVGRDMTAFTTKRVLIIDVQGWSGKKVEYKSIPYMSIRAFAVESAGSWDRDAQMSLWCKTYWLEGPNSLFKQDLRKGRADIIAIQSFLAAQVIGFDDGSATLVHGAAEGEAGAVDGFLQWIGDDAHQMDPKDVNDMLHKSPPILQSDEVAELCFKVGRDMCIFTTKRVLQVDVQGWTGKKVEYKSFPLKHLSAFEVESAGSIALLASAKVTYFTDVPGCESESQDLSKSATNIWAVNSFLAKKLLGDGARSTKGASKGGYSNG